MLTVKLVAMDNFEMSTYPLTRDYSASELHGYGGGNRTRTCHLMLAKHLLYQMSYTPTKLAREPGIEPNTSIWQGARESNPLAFYWLGGLSRIQTTQHLLMKEIGFPITLKPKIAETATLGLLPQCFSSATLSDTWRCYHSKDYRSPMIVYYLLCGSCFPLDSISSRIHGVIPSVTLDRTSVWWQLFPLATSFLTLLDRLTFASSRSFALAGFQWSPLVTMGRFHITLSSRYCLIIWRLWAFTYSHSSFLSRLLECFLPLQDRDINLVEVVTLIKCRWLALTPITWRRWRESNPPKSDRQSGALPRGLQRHI